jgi:hypothetical protein
MPNFFSMSSNSNRSVMLMFACFAESVFPMLWGAAFAMNLLMSGGIAALDADIRRID